MNLQFSLRLLATEELVLFAQIVKQVVQHCGDETIKENLYVMHVDCITNSIRYVVPSLHLISFMKYIIPLGESATKYEKGRNSNQET